jgi:Tfp pilus assembly protein FimT
MVGILAGLAAPRLAQWSAATRANSVTREVAFAMQLARIQAISLNATVAVCFYAPNSDFPYEFYSVHPQSQGWCPTPPTSSSDPAIWTAFKNTVGQMEGVTLVSTDRNPFSFNSRGFVAAGTITLANTRGRQKQIIVSRYGRARIANVD